MRIAQVAPPWLAVPPAGYGGIEWVVSLLADGLVDAGHDVTLFATGDSETRAHLDSIFETAPGSSAINSAMPEVAQTLEVFRDPSRFDLVHTHLPFSQLVAAAMADVSSVHTLHYWFSAEARAVYSRAADSVHYVAISESQRAQMPELNYAGVVYNGIDLERYPFRADKEDFLLFLGRTAPEKGLRRAVEAANAAGTKLVAAVKAAAAHEVVELESVQSDLDGDVVFLGEISVEEKADLLARARAVLFPIDWEEPFGLVMTEANACGTPVIATPRGAVPEVVADGETGFIVSVEDYASETASALGRLGEINPTACRARVHERFSKEAMVAGYEAVYEKILAEAAAG